MKDNELKCIILKELVDMDHFDSLIINMERLFKLYDKKISKLENKFFERKPGQNMFNVINKLESLSNLKNSLIQDCEFQIKYVNKMRKSNVRYINKLNNNPECFIEIENRTLNIIKIDFLIERLNKLIIYEKSLTKLWL